MPQSEAEGKTASPVSSTQKEVDLMISGEQRAGEARCLWKHFSTTAVAAIKDFISFFFVE